MSAPPRLLVLLLFCLSGLSGLVYEVLWTRMFTLVLGTMVHAVSTVLAVYMGGMALGSWWFGRRAARPGSHGLRLYGLLELGIGVAALAVPLLLAAAEPLYRAAAASLDARPAGMLAVRVAVAVLVLAVPTTLMGGTLPALSRLLVAAPERAGRELGLLYALNTLGAVAGCGLSGFVLLEHLGLRATLAGAVAVSLLVGAAALALARRCAAAPAPPSAPVPAVGGARPGLVAFAVSGALALALEVLWTRSLMYFVSVDTWAFAAMLCAFLLGLALGSLLAAPLARRARRPLVVLALLQLLVALGAAASLPLFDQLFALQDQASRALGSGLAGEALLRLFLSAVVMLLPCAAMGAALPFAAQAWLPGGGDPARATGVLFALNTAGTIVGSLAAGFALVPLLGIQRGILLVAALYAALGTALLAISRARLLRLPAALPAAMVVLALAALVFPTPLPMILRSHWFRRNPEGYRLLGYWETTDATVAVLEKHSGMRELNINGFSTACDNYMDMQVHRMLSHLPMLVHPMPRRVLVVGFGMGSTTFGCCQHPDAQVDVVELLAVERKTAPFFAHINHGVLDAPNLRFVHADGRNHLLATAATYDVITFNAIHPRYSANLYTEDFYRLCRQRLGEDGVICAWVTQNGLGPDDWRMLCRSLTEVFPEASLWYCNPQHFCLLGSRRPLPLDPRQWAARMAVPAVRADLAESNLHDPAVLLARHLLGGAALRDYLATARRNTDDRPRIEFTRSASAHDERDVVVDLMGRRQSVATLLGAGVDAAFRERLRAVEASTQAMMAGQTEFWYPTGPLRAEIAFRKALLLCPDNEDVRHDLGFSDVQRRRIAADRAARPGDPLVTAAWARIELEAGRAATVEPLLEEVLRGAPGTLAAAQLLARARLLTGKAEPAAALFGQLVRQRPEDALAAQGLGVALQRAGRSAEAAALLARAASLDPDAAELFTLREQTPRAVTAR